MNPICIDDKRSFVWTVSKDKSEVAKGNAYCIYLYGNLHIENLDVHNFLKLYDELSPSAQKNKVAA
jgi:hypothetical protein